MSSAIIDGTNIDLSVINYTSPKANPAGGKVISVMNKLTKEPLTLRAPVMGAWSASEGQKVVGKNPDGTSIKEGTGKYSMGLQFATGQYSTPESEEFLRQLKALEQKIKQDALTNSLQWFGKEIKSMEVMDEKIPSMLKYPFIKGTEQPDYNAMPTLNMKLPCWKDVWQTSVFDEEGKPLYVKGKAEPGVSPLDFLVSPFKAPMQVVCLIQCAGLWFVGPLMYITWNLKQVVVKKPRQPLISDDTCYLSVTESESHALKSQPEAEAFVAGDDVCSAYVADSDGEEEDHAYVLPPPKKTRVEEAVTAAVTVEASAPMMVVDTPIPPLPPLPIPVEPAPAVAAVKPTVKKAVVKKAAVVKA